MIFNEQTFRGTDDFPIGFYRIDCNHSKYIMQYHWHKEIEIIRILEGKLKLTLNNTEILAQKGEILFVNSEIVHGAIPDDCIYECVVFDPQKVLLNSDDAKRFASGLVDHNVFVFHRIKQDQSRFCKSANKLFDSFRPDDEYYRFSVIGAIYELFGVICSQKLYTENSSYGSFMKDKNIIKLKKILEYMRNNYKSQLTLEELSDFVNVSPKYFCTFFKQMTGMTAFEYLNNYRVERAARALISTDESITEIAYTYGFNDLSYFIKTFKKCKGVTPKAFRNSHYEKTGS